MTTAPVDETDLPPYRHRGPCPRCGGRGPIRVHFDRDCAEVRGDHYHRLCPCGYQWVERCTEERDDPVRAH
jgi:hypothetical protein